MADVNAASKVCHNGLQLTNTLFGLNYFQGLLGCLESKVVLEFGSVIQLTKDNFGNFVVLDFHKFAV